VIALVQLVTLYDVLKWISVVLGLALSGRKIYRWLRRKLNKRKTRRK
jgi:hypothetical protein